jgi:methylenetetrahydrofolate dehydrogenase (NADP+)/methenyltetrahydrofolate cyclohydrolase
MSARILDGRALAAEVRADVAARASALRERGIVPSLAVVIAGDDPASRGYVRSIENAGAKAGVDVRVHALPESTAEEPVRALLRTLAGDAGVHGVILQQPLPPHLAARRLAAEIPPRKDVDGANPANLGLLAAASSDACAPATPLACMLLLDRSARRDLRGVRACVVGRSSVVGLPVALLLLARDATVTIAHSRTRDLARTTRDAEVLVVAAGRPRMITSGMVAPGATVIDVGTTYVDGKVTGDVDDAVAEVAGEITPVPGGVGPVTNAALLGNVVTVAERARSR